MAQIYAHRYNPWRMLKIGLAPIGLASISLSIGIGTPTLAQITPDDSLGNERSVVNRDVQIRGRRGNRIIGGARRGANLFHSFQEFNVNERQRVYFANPAGVKLILGRITGSDISDILGTLGVEGSANLFLLNPNGVLFGPNARLDITGSFLASTGQRLLFSEGNEFSAVNPQTPPLTISAPIGVQYGGMPGSIAAEGSLSLNSSLDPGLRVGIGQTLALLGGDLQLNQTILSAPGGRIELAAVQDGTIEWDTTDAPRFNFPTQTPRGTITLNQSQLQVLADQDGDIAIHARDLALNQSGLLAGIASGRGKPQNFGGDISLDATNRITLANQSVVSTSVSPENDLFSDRPGIEVPAAIGNGGNVDIRAATLNVTGGSQIVSSTFGQGNAGNISINVSDRVSLRGVVATSVDPESSAVFSRVNPQAQGNGGNIQIFTDFLELSDGAQMSTSTQGRGNAGNITINARDQAVLRGRNRSFNDINTAILSRVEAGSNGNGGNLLISAPSLQVSNGAQLRAETEATGNAGDITINARDQVQFSGVNAEGLASNAFSSVEQGGNGVAGNIQITTDLLTIREGASLFSRNLADRAAGDVIVQADQLYLDQGQINAETVSGQGSNIVLSISDSIRLDRDSRIIAQTQSGQGGDIAVNVGREPVNSMEVTQSLITAQATQSGDAGDLTLNVRRLTAQDSDLLALTQTGTGGNILLQGLDRLQLNRSRITASTVKGRAGNLTVNADRSVEISDRSRLSVEATGNRGQAGDLIINTDELTVTANAAATVSSRAGAAGNLTINADQVFLNHGRLTAETAENRSGESTANLNLNDLDLLISQNNSLISAEARQESNGGNVTISAEDGFVIASVNENNDVVASADRGKGGAVEITTQGLFGLDAGRAEPRNLTNDIDVTSNFGLQGTVTINQLEVAPSQGLVELPTEIPNLAVAQICPDQSNPDATSEFFVTGRGGLPSNPTTPLSGETLLADWVALEPGATVSESILPSSDLPLVEAQGWQIGAEGEVIFVAHVPSVSLPNLALSELRRHPPDCS